MDNLSSLAGIIETLSGLTGTVLVVGAPDSGKTTLIGQVARRAIERGTVVAIVDADVGQSEIGPPAAIGMSLFREVPQKFCVRRPQALAFVGSTQPFGFFLEMVAGTAAMVDAARREGAGLILVDTTGFAPNFGGIRLKEEKLLRLRPEHVLLIERRRELHPIAQLAQGCQFCTLHRVPIPEGAHIKPPAFRRGHRKKQFAEYFGGARTHTLSLRGLGVHGCTLLTGRALSPAARVRATEYLQTPILRAELTPGRLNVIGVRKPSPDGGAILQQRFPNIQVRVHAPDVLNGVLCGLEDGTGRLLDLAIITRFDFTNLVASLISPFSDMQAVRLLKVGAVRLAADGTEHGTLRPGEL